MNSPPAIDLFASFYEGSQGPTIRISTHSPEVLRWLQSQFVALGTGKMREISLEAGNPVMDGLMSLHLRSIRSERELRHASRVLRASQDPAEGWPAFVWRDSESAWLDNADLVAGLVESDRPCHQYFAGEESDDAMIIISYGE